MNKQKSILIAVSLLLHVAILAFAFETTEVESSKIIQPAEIGLQPVKENERKQETTQTDEAKWNTKSVKVSMYREELPSVVIEREFVTSLRTEMLLLVIVSACFHTVAYLKLKGSNQSEQDNPITRP
jgi:hypothetical protein